MQQNIFLKQCKKKSAKANNPLLERYDPDKPSSHILHLDAKYLYGWAMSHLLPTGGAFRFEEDCEQLAKSIADHPADDPGGFILEVDLKTQNSCTRRTRPSHYLQSA